MNNSLRWQFVFTVISLLQLNVDSNSQPLQTSSEDDVKAQLPRDFIKFLESIDPKKNGTKHKLVGKNYHEETTSKSNNARKSIVTEQMTQNNALRDVLMMKLVSYYEDKYRISHHDRQRMPKYDRPLPIFYNDDINRITGHEENDRLSSKPYERASLTSRADYEDNKYRMHTYDIDTAIPTLSAELSNNKIGISVAPRRTLEISDASKDSIDKMAVAEVVVL